MATTGKRSAKKAGRRKKAARKKKAAARKKAPRRNSACSQLLDKHEASGRGRPSEYEPRIASMILDLLAVGESLRSICSAEGMPNRSTVMRWARDGEFRDQYMRAREDGLYSRADEIIDIADDSSEDFSTVTGRDGVERRVFDAEAVARSKLRVNSRQWELVRLLSPYRDRQEIKHSGPDEVDPALAEVILKRWEQFKRSQSTPD